VAATIVNPVTTYTTTTAGISSYSATAPTGATTGDTLFAITFCDNDGHDTSLTASGWTQVGSSSAGTGPGTANSSGFAKLWTRTATTATSYTMGADTASANFCIMWKETGHNTTTPVQVNPVWSHPAAATVTTLVAPTVTATAAGQLVCFFIVEGTVSTGTITAPSGMSGTSTKDTVFFLLSLAAGQSVSAGATGTKSAALTSPGTNGTGTQGYLTMSFVINDAVVTPTPATVVGVAAVPAPARVGPVNTPATVAGVASVGAAAVRVPALPATVAAVAGIGAPKLASPKIATFVDDFATADAAKWTGYGANPTVSSGRLSIVPDPGYSSLFSVRTYDLTSSQIAVQVVSPPNIGNGTTQCFFMQCRLDSGNLVQWIWGNGTILADYVIAGGGTSPYTATYSGVTHAWLRITESAGTVAWDYSGDGVSWTNAASASIPWDKSALNVYTAAGYFGTEPAPGAMLLDNLNLLPASVATPSTVTAVAGVGSAVVQTPVPAATVAAVAAVGSPTVRLSVLPAPATVVAAAGVGVATVLTPVPAATVTAVAAVGAPTIRLSVLPAPATVTGVTAVGAVVVKTLGVATVVATTAVGSVTFTGTALVTASTVPAVTAVGAVLVRTAIAAATVTATASVPAAVVSLPAAAAPASVVAVAGVGSVVVKTAIQAATVVASAAVGSVVVTSNAVVASATVVAVAAVPAATVTTVSIPRPGTVTGVAGVGSPAVTGTTLITVGSVAALATVPAVTVGSAALAGPGTVVAVAGVGRPFLRINPPTVRCVTTVPTPTAAAKSPAGGVTAVFTLGASVVGGHRLVLASATGTRGTVSTITGSRRNSS
jgi:hypothetical protein